jgi:uncharacterized membrane protein YgcG
MSNAEPSVAAHPSPPKSGGSKFAKVTLWTIGILALTCGVLAIVGLLLPAEYAVERSIVVKAAPQHVHQQLVDLKNWPKWNAEHPDREYTYSGESLGEGAVQSWTEPNRPEAKLTITWENPIEGIQYTVHRDGDESPVKGSVRYAPDENGTRVTWRVRGSIGNNPIDRWRGLLLDRDVGLEFETGLENLKPIVEKQVAQDRERAAELAKLAAKMPAAKRSGPGFGGPGGGGGKKRAGGKRGGRGKAGGGRRGGGGTRKRPPTDDGSKTPTRKPATAVPEPRVEK